MSSNIPPRNIRPLQTRHRMRKADNFGRLESQHDIDEIINFVRNRQNTNLQLQRESTEIGLKKKPLPLPGIGAASALPGIGETLPFERSVHHSGSDSDSSDRRSSSDSKEHSDFTEAAFPHPGVSARRSSHPDRLEVHLKVGDTTTQSDSGHSNSSWDTDNPDTDAAYESDFENQDTDFKTDGAKSRSPTPPYNNYDQHHNSVTQTGHRLCKSMDGIPGSGSPREPELYKCEPGRRPGVSRSLGLPPVLPDRPSAPVPTQTTQSQSQADIMVFPERPSAPSPSVTPPLSEEGTGSQDDPIDYIDSH